MPAIVAEGVGGRMGTYILRRLVASIPVLFVVSLLVFGLMRLIPGDAVMANLGATGHIPAADLQELRQELGLDVPFPVQYVRWVAGVMHGDFGKSLWTRGSAWKRMTDALPVSAELGIVAIIVSTLIALPGGVISAIRPGTVSDYSARLFSIAWLALPDFWVGTLVVVIPALWWKYQAPIGFVPLRDDPLTNLQQILPAALILGFRLSAAPMRMARSSMLEVMRQDYIRTANAKGLPGRAVVIRHAMKNALLPVITIIGAQIGFLFRGQIVLETLFILPGMGNLLFSSIGNRDYTEIQACVMFLAVILVLTNLLTDISYAWIDPRIRYR
jgi:peptide/nickel transport system permease protein